LVCEPLPHLLQLQVWATHPPSEPLSGHLRALSSAQGRTFSFNKAVSSALSFLSSYTGFPQQGLASVCLDLGQKKELRRLERTRYARSAAAARKRGGAAPRKAVIGDEGERLAGTSWGKAITNIITVTARHVQTPTHRRTSTSSPCAGYMPADFSREGDSEIY
jgi:hypothetical protein